MEVPDTSGDDSIGPPSATFHNMLHLLFDGTIVQPAGTAYNLPLVEPKYATDAFVVGDDTTGAPVPHVVTRKYFSALKSYTLPSSDPTNADPLNSAGDECNAPPAVPWNNPGTSVPTFAALIVVSYLFSDVPVLLYRKRGQLLNTANERVAASPLVRPMPTMFFRPCRPAGTFNGVLVNLPALSATIDD